MGPLEVTAGIAAALLAVAVGVWVAARRRERRRREVERRDDARVRAQVLERLARVTAEWEGRADELVTDVNVTAANVSDLTETDEPRAPVGGRAAAVSGLGHAVDEHPRHRRPGHGIRVRRDRRA